MAGRKQFPFDEFEPAWQKRWDTERTFSVPNPGDPDFDGSKPKYFVLDMFPYPSGSGLHVGHPEGYTATDIIARYQRMRGFNVLHPMGWDAFGLPAEEHARKTGEHPRINTENNVGNFRRQLKRLGFAYDWEREVNTTEPGYVKWTQWIFLQLYNSYFDPEEQKAKPISLLEDILSDEPQHRDEWKDNPFLSGTHDAWRKMSEKERKGFRRSFIDHHRLAYVAEAPVNWSPDLGTVLANEEVEEWRAKGHTVERRPLKQWMLRITKYAQRLIDELEDLDWPEGIKLLQKNWIGRSEGAEVEFQIGDHAVTVFTTRPDTLFGATYMVLAPEHPLVDEITTAEQKDAVGAYRRECAAKSDRERTEPAKEKTGVFTGGTAVNPVNGEEIPVWIADYVMMTYGTGAIMAVPAHDERDFEFAEKYSIPIIPVVGTLTPKVRDFDEEKGYSKGVNEFVELEVGGENKVVFFSTDVCDPGEGVSVNSDFLDGLPTAEAIRRISAWLEEKGLGRATVTYKLRDWLFSRQRYWGEPFPIVWRDGNHEAISEDELPLLAPELEDYKPTGDPEPILSKATDWVDLGGGVTRETNTMPQWAGSCWYYLRFCDAKNETALIRPEAERYWMAGGRTAVSAEASPSAISDLPSTHAGGVDLYIGGTEHAVLHLLYARFWHKVLYDLGHLSTREPFQRLVNQGLILGETDYFLFKKSLEESAEAVSSKLVGEIEESGAHLVGIHKETGEKVIGVPLPGRDEDVEKIDGVFYWKQSPDIAVADKAFKMSKSRGNVLSPDDIVDDYGADSLRLYEMFMGPLEQVKPWSMKGVEGVYRFLARVWRLVMERDQEGHWSLRDTVSDSGPDKATNKVVHATIKKVTEDIESLSFNTAIAQMMVCTNELNQLDIVPVRSVLTLLQVLNPFAPHLTEELSARLGEHFPEVVSGELADRPWPDYDEAFLVEDEIEIVIQVNGKVRDKMMIAIDVSEEEVENLALARDKVKEHIGGLTVRKVIVVPGRLVNVVVN